MALDTNANNERRNCEQRGRTNDPQITVQSTLKETREGEMLVFQFDLALFQIVCLANIPAEGETSAPVYIKFKTRWPRRREERDVREDDSDD